MKVELKTIGTVSNNRKDLEDDYWKGVVSVITLDPREIEITATKGLETFSHVEIIFYMNKVEHNKVITGARHPRNNHDFPETGILAQRAKNRPNQLGLSFAKIVKVDGLQITVEDLDAIDGTPIFDIKPVIKEFLPREEITQPEWVGLVMQNYYT